MEIAFGPKPAKDRVSGTIIDGPVLHPHPKDTSAGPWRANGFVAQVEQRAGHPEVTWIQLTGIRLSGGSVAPVEGLDLEPFNASMAFHLPLDPEREKKRVWGDVPPEVKELAEQVLASQAQQ